MDVLQSALNFRLHWLEKYPIINHKKGVYRVSNSALIKSRGLATNP